MFLVNFYFISIRLLWKKIYWWINDLWTTKQPERAIFRYAKHLSKKKRIASANVMDAVLKIYWVSLSQWIWKKWWYRCIRYLHYSNVEKLLNKNRRNSERFYQSKVLYRKTNQYNISIVFARDFPSKRYILSTF